MNIPRIVFAAPSSGSGKTTVTCGILQALKERGRGVVSFKCGPDYIDPMFQERVIGVPSGTLDLFFSEPDTLRRLFCKNAAGAEIAVDGSNGPMPWNLLGFFSAGMKPLPFFVITWMNTGRYCSFAASRTSVRASMSWPSTGP